MQIVECNAIRKEECAKRKADRQHEESLEQWQYKRSRYQFEVMWLQADTYDQDMHRRKVTHDQDMEKLHVSLEIEQERGLAVNQRLDREVELQKLKLATIQAVSSAANNRNIQDLLPMFVSSAATPMSYPSTSVFPSSSSSTTHPNLMIDGSNVIHHHPHNTAGEGNESEFF